MSLLKLVKAVTFDVGGTLIQPWPSVGHVYAAAAARHGHPNILPEILNRQFAAVWQSKRSFDHSRSAWFEVVEKTFAGALDKSSVQNLFDELYACFGAPEAWQVFEEVHPTLELLRSRELKLGIISNWDERLRPLLARLQLTRYFAAIIISVEAGFAKPSEKIFQRATAALGLVPGSILHIGDSFSEDVAGARAAGLQGLLLDRKEATPAVASIATLAKLKDLFDTC